MGKKSSKTTSTSTPWAPAQPLLLGAGQGITNTVNANAGNLANVESGITGSTIPGLQQQIGDQRQQLQPGMDFINRTLGGQYLNSNPNIDRMAALAGQDAGNAVNSAFSAAGRTGGGNHAADLARGVSQADLGVRNQDYLNERQNQTQAASMLPGYGTSQFAGYGPLLAGQQLAGQLPYYGANALGNIGGLYGGYGTQAGTQPGGWGTGLLGAAANMFSFSPISLSDRRLKVNIAKVGEASDGLGIYEWNWKAAPSGERARGVMADEVEKLRPQAFVRNYHGEFAGVNYAALGSMA